MALTTADIREDRPPYVIFERQAIEDRAASEREGRYMTKDLDFVIITPIGSKDRIPRVVEDWFKYLEQQVREERFRATWLQHYKEAYKAWKAGQEVPALGTPIKGWPVLSPSQQANVIGANVLTVEDLAQANDEARRRIGMGAQELVDKAITWLKVAKEKGTPVQEISALQAKIKALESRIGVLEKENTELRAENRAKETA